DACRKHPEQHEMENIGRNHTERDTVDTLCRQIKMIDKLADRCAGMHENARHMLPVERIEHEQDGYDRQWPADGAPRRLQKDQNQKTAENDIRGRRITDAE